MLLTLLLSHPYILVEQIESRYLIMHDNLMINQGMVISIYNGNFDMP